MFTAQKKETGCCFFRGEAGGVSGCILQTGTHSLYQDCSQSTACGRACGRQIGL